MNIEEMSGLLYSYTSGYPFLVSRICKLMDEIVTVSEKRVVGREQSYEAVFGDSVGQEISSALTKEGFLEAVKILAFEKNPLSLVNKLADYPELGKMMRSILFAGDSIPYNSGNHVIDIESMFGFIRNDHGTVAIANRIFETRLYDLFLSEQEVNSRIFKEGNITGQR